VERPPLFPMWTGRSHVPWLWVVLFAFPAFSNTLMESISGTAMTFTMKKFISDPALITFLGSINIAFNFLVAPWAAWKSDHIWTRYGRRRPFLLIGWSLLLISLICIPLAPTLSILIACIVVCQFAADFGYTGPWTPLYYEMIPSHQRGRAVIIKRVGTVLSRLVFNLVLLVHFDSVLDINWTFGLLNNTTFRLTGEMLIYWAGGLAVLVVLLQMWFLVRERRPDQLPERARFSPLGYVRELFGERQWRLLFLLMFCSLALTAGLGQLQPLLITEQFGYSKKLLGQIQSVNLVVEVFIILPAAVFMIDRLDRFRIFQVGLFLSTLQPLAYWIFVEYFANNGIPTPGQIVFFNIWNSLSDVAAGLALEPLLFDFVPKNKMGTINSGFLFVRGALSLLVFNGVGLWVKYYTQWFQPPGTFDYMSGYLYVFLIGVLGVIATQVFAYHLRNGHLVMYGRLEEEAAAAREHERLAQEGTP
jgi:Na+/melibiose symporter-like transporter